MVAHWLASELLGCYAGMVTAEELWGLIVELQGNAVSQVKHMGLLQLACAASCSLEGTQAESWEAASRREQQMELLSAEGAWISHSELRIGACAVQQQAGSLLPPERAETYALCMQDTVGCCIV